MTEDKASIADLDAIGTMLAAAQFGGVILGSALYGIQFFMALSSLSAFLRGTKEARQGHVRYIVISCVILVAFTAELALIVSRTFFFLFTEGPEPRSYIDAFLKDAKKSGALIIAGDAMIGVSVAVGDALLIWRCFILWNHKKWVVLLPCITCIGALVSFIMSFINGLPISELTVAALSLSVSTNVMVTLLILLRLRITWAATSKAFPNRRTPRMYLDVAGALVEAAVPLSAFGICFIAMTVLSAWYRPKGSLSKGRNFVLFEILGRLYYTFCFLSPQMIIYRVATGRSWKDATESRNGGTNITHPIQFARDEENEGSDISSGRV
ncbi:hypothetical protein BKA70DRAFT_1561780 [Coprinopsis sp. MPI-PUGE-AT-0042]|nr:hypothetical protein BKA70DRAFT_1561780 [Coprinopsis sp. MPI-PUGE-AT-0042]